MSNSVSEGSYAIVPNTYQIISLPPFLPEFECVGVKACTKNFSDVEAEICAKQTFIYEVILSKHPLGNGIGKTSGSRGLGKKV